MLPGPSTLAAIKIEEGKDKLNALKNVPHAYVQSNKKSKWLL